MKIYIKKSNTDIKQEFIIPKNETYNYENWAYIIIDHRINKFTVEKIHSLNIVIEDWEIKENYTFPSSLLNEFLRNDLI